MRYLGISNFTEIDRMTIHEYRLRMKAFNLQRIDKSRDVHMQAWVNEQAKATRKSGKRYFSDFKSFFDYEKEEGKILKMNANSEVSPLADLIANANKKGGE